MWIYIAVSEVMTMNYKLMLSRPSPKLDFCVGKGGMLNHTTRILNSKSVTC